MQGNKCLDLHDKWEEKDPANKGRCFTCGVKPKQANSHISTYCERPGGGDQFANQEAKVHAWLTTALPRRPNGEQPRM